MATFGIFDHIEDIPGTPTDRLFRDRLDLIKQAEEAGFTGFYLAEHHGSELCMAPNQELFIAAASQVTTSIRLGPMVKSLPLHHPVSILEDMCVADQLTGGRLEYGVGRGAAPIEHYWFSGDWRASRDRFVDTLGIVSDALRTGVVSSENSAFYDFPSMPLATRPLQETIPFWYPGSPEMAGRYGMSLMFPGPIEQAAYDAYLEAWQKHKGERIRLEGPNGEPRVGCVLILAIAPSEREALDVARRGVNGLMRRTHSVHEHDRRVLPEAECEAALGPLRHLLARAEDTIAFGAGTPAQVAERLARILEPGLVNHLVLQLPTGDMTYDEAKRTLELFVTEVKPQLDEVSAVA